MDKKQVEQAIRDKLREREKQVVNRNALAALLGALKLDVLGKIFLGRKDALETEKLHIQQEIVLDLLCKIDSAISSAKTEASKQNINWTIISGEIEAHGVDVEEVTGARISSNAGPIELEPGTHIRASCERAKRVTGLYIGGKPNTEKEGIMDAEVFVGHTLKPFPRLINSRTWSRYSWFLDRFNPYRTYSPRYSSKSRQTRTGLLK